MFGRRNKLSATFENNRDSVPPNAVSSLLCAAALSWRARNAVRRKQTSHLRKGASKSQTSPIAEEGVLRQRVWLSSCVGHRAQLQSAIIGQSIVVSMSCGSANCLGTRRLNPAGWGRNWRRNAKGRQSATIGKEETGKRHSASNLSNLAPATQKAFSFSASQTRKRRPNLSLMDAICPQSNHPG